MCKLFRVFTCLCVLISVTGCSKNAIHDELSSAAVSAEDVSSQKPSINASMDEENEIVMFGGKSLPATIIVHNVLENSYYRVIIKEVAFRKMSEHELARTSYPDQKHIAIVKYNSRQTWCDGKTSNVAKDFGLGSEFDIVLGSTLFSHEIGSRSFTLSEEEYVTPDISSEGYYEGYKIISVDEAAATSKKTQLRFFSGNNPSEKLYFNIY